KDGEGRLVATLDDYELVREVTTDAYAAAQDAGVRPIHRKTLDALRAACQEKGWPAREEAGVGHNELAKRLAIDKGTLTVRMRVLLREGYAADLNARPDGRPARGRPARYVPGDDPPEQGSQLPTREAVAARLGEAPWETTPEPERGASGGGGKRLQHPHTPPFVALAPDHGDSGGVLRSPFGCAMQTRSALQ